MMQFRVVALVCCCCLCLCYFCYIEVTSPRALLARSSTIVHSNATHPHHMNNNHTTSTLHGSHSSKISHQNHKRTQSTATASVISRKEQHKARLKNAIEAIFEVNAAREEYIQHRNEVLEMLATSSLHRTAVAICFLVVLICSCCLEICLKSSLKRARSESLRAVAEVLLKELVVLGIMSFSLFMASELHGFESLSIAVFGTPAELNSLLHQAHMLLFLLMVAYIALVVLVLHFTRGRTRYWNGCETLFADQHEAASNPSKGKTVIVAATKSFPEYVQMRTQFVHSLTRLGVHLPEDFNFAQYLSLALGETFANAVDVKALSWIVVAAFIPISWLYMTLQTSWIKVVVFCSVPCLMFVVALWLRRRLHKIRYLLTGINAKNPFASKHVHELTVCDPHLPKETTFLPPYMTDTSTVFSRKVPSNLIERWIARGQPYFIANPHLQLFPFSIRGPSFIKHMLRVELILSAIVVAMLIYDVAIDFAHIEPESATETVEIQLPVIVEVCLGVPCVCLGMWLIADCIRLLTICTSIEMMPRHELLHQVIESAVHARRHSAAKVNSTLRALLRRLKMELRFSQGMSPHDGDDDSLFAEGSLTAMTRAVFESMDVHQKGKIGVSEIAALLSSLGLAQIEECEMFNVMLSVDLDGDSMASLPEVLAFVQEMQRADSLLHPQSLIDNSDCLLLFTHFSRREPLLPLNSFAGAIMALNPHLNIKDVHAWYWQHNTEDACVSLSQFKHLLHRASF